MARGLFVGLGHPTDVVSSLKQYLFVCLFIFVVRLFSNAPLVAGATTTAAAEYANVAAYSHNVRSFYVFFFFFFVFKRSLFTFYNAPLRRQPPAVARFVRRHVFRLTRRKNTLEICRPAFGRAIIFVLISRSTTAAQ